MKVLGTLYLIKKNSICIIDIFQPFKMMSSERWLKGRPSVIMRGFEKNCTVKKLRKQFQFFKVNDIHISRIRGESRGFGLG